MRRETLERLPLGVRPLLRKLAVAGFAPLRLVGASRVARGKLPTGPSAVTDLPRRYGDHVDCSASFRVDEPRPASRLRYASGPRLVPRAVDTFTLVVDAAHAGFSFRNNVVIAPDRHVVTEQRIAWDALEVSRCLLEPVRRVAGTVAYLSNTDVGNISHWLCFALPLIDVYRRRLGVEADYYYVGRPLRDFHVETLGMLGVGPERILTDAVAGDRMVAAIANRAHGTVDGDTVGFIRRHIGGQRSGQAAARRLFIGRGDATFRRLLNHDECWRLLRGYGFEHVTTGGMTVAQQVELLSGAEAVVAVHGAGLTHVLWTSEGTKVVELLSSAWQNPWYLELAGFVGCDYAYVVGQPTPGFGAGDREREREDNLRRRADVLVDVAELGAALAALGLTRVTDDDAGTRSVHDR